MDQEKQGTMQTKLHYSQKKVRQYSDHQHMWGELIVRVCSSLTLFMAATYTFGIDGDIAAV